MRRTILLLTVALVMAVMLVVIAAPAMAKNVKVGRDPEDKIVEVQTGEPIWNWGDPQHSRFSRVTHCGPLFELAFGFENVHGALPSNSQRGLVDCVQAPLFPT